jgi:VanZ family protein
MTGDREQGTGDSRRSRGGTGGGATLVRWLPAMAWAGAIFFLSSRSRLPEPPGILGWDKLQHCLGYGVGGYLVARAAGARGRGTLAAVVIGSLYGASDELHQWFVRGRNADVLDWVADTLGVVAGALLYRFVSLRRRGRESAAGAVELRAT